MLLKVFKIQAAVKVIKAVQLKIVLKIYHLQQLTHWILQFKIIWKETQRAKSKETIPPL